MITYGTLISHVRPFFLSRGGDALANNERMLFYANCAVQDAYNIDSATFTYKTELGILAASNGDTNKFTTESSLRKVQEVIGTFSDGRTVELRPTLFKPKEYCNSWVKFESGSDMLITSNEIVSLDITYIKEYRWATLDKLTEVIQVPNRYIPAIIKMMMDWASPVNLMSGEGSTVDFFSHAMTRFNKLADDDALTDMYQLNR